MEKLHGEYTSRISAGPYHGARPTGRTGPVPFRKTSTKAPNSKYFRWEVKLGCEDTTRYLCADCGQSHQYRKPARKCCK